MTLWKLGCRWGSNTPLFYEFIYKNNIVIGWGDKTYNIGDWLLITDGFSVLAFAKVVGEPQISLNYPQYQNDFLKLQIPFQKELSIYNAHWIVLKNEDRFNYDLQQGIARVQSYEAKIKFKSLLSQYQKSMDLEKKIEILKNKKQIILQGPPGTGKTYTAKDIAEQMIFNAISADKKIQKENLENSDQFKLIQFHPAYSYEDFVRGITAKNNGHNIEYKTENKLLASFARQALKNYEDSRKDAKSISEEQSIENIFEDFIDSIQDELDEKGKYSISKSAYINQVDNDAFRYTGDKWSATFRIPFTEILKMYRLNISERKEIKKQSLVSGRAKMHATYYFNLLEKFRAFIPKIVVIDDLHTVNENNYVLVIDEINRANLPAVLGELIYALEYRGEKVESMYDIDGDNSLIIPPNLYIIGTMNTADRSVGHIDYAIRRRFAFVDILPNVNIITNQRAKALFEEISHLFTSKDTLASDFKPEQVQLGHSYFIVKGDEELQLKAKYEIIPILEEYLKDGIFLEKAEKTILDLKQRFGN